MPRYKLKDKCLFVDAKALDGSRNSAELPHGYAHLLDKRSGTANVLKFNDTAGFIARFILFGVELGLIPEIVHSEFGDQVKDPLSEVQTVFKMLAPYVVERTEKDRMSFEPSSSEDKGSHSGKYDLDFSVNFYVSSGISKVPY